MTTLTVTEACSKLYGLIDEVAADHKFITIKGKRTNAVFATITKHLDDFQIFVKEVMQWLDATRRPERICSLSERLYSKRFSLCAL